MTFNVIQNVDTCFSNAYVALQANTLQYLLLQPDSQWKTEILNKIIRYFLLFDLKVLLNLHMQNQTSTKLLRTLY